MTWDTIRSHYPAQWLVIEARQARNEGEQRILEDIETVAVCASFQEATHVCSDVHAEKPYVELYCVNTEWVDLNIGVPQNISVLPRNYATRIKRRTTVA